MKSLKEGFRWRKILIYLLRSPSYYLLCIWLYVIFMLDLIKSRFHRIHDFVFFIFLYFCCSLISLLDLCSGRSQHNIHLIWCQHIVGYVFSYFWHYAIWSREGVHNTHLMKYARHSIVSNYAKLIAKLLYIQRQSQLCQLY